MTTAPAQIPDGAQHPKERRELRAQRIEQTVEWYQGVVPHPEHLERFEALLPGATDRFLALAERQSAHRQRLENKFMNLNGAASITGAISAGVVSLVSVGGAIYLLATGHGLMDFAACLTPLAPIIWAFRKARSSESKEMAKKKSS